MDKSSEYLCLNCGVNEALHEYCDDCLESLQGDWVIVAGEDWVVHVSEEEEEQGMVADDVLYMLSVRPKVTVLFGAKAKEAPKGCAPDIALNGPHGEAGLWLRAGGRLEPLDDYGNDWSQALQQALERYEEAEILSSAGLAAEEQRLEALLDIAPVGPISRPSALAESDLTKAA